MSEADLQRQIDELKHRLNLVENGRLGRNTWTDWTPKQTGFSTPMTIATSRYIVIGRLCIWRFRPTFGSGVSDATTLTLTAPIANGQPYDIHFTVPIMVDNGSTKTTQGMGRMAASSNLIEFFTTPAGGTWTASNSKNVAFTFAYEVP